MRSITAPTPRVATPHGVSTHSNHGFIKIPHELIGAVSPGAVLIYAVFCDDPRTGWRRRNHAEIARRCGWTGSITATNRRVGRAVTELVSTGWLARRTQWIASETSVPYYQPRQPGTRWEPLPRTVLQTAANSTHDTGTLVAHYLGWKRLAGRSRWTEAPTSQVADLLGASKVSVSKVRRILGRLGLVKVENLAGRAPRMWFDPEALNRADEAEKVISDPPSVMSDGSPHLVSDDPPSFMSPLVVDASLDDSSDARLASASRVTSPHAQEPADKPPSTRKLLTRDAAAQAAWQFVATQPRFRELPGRVRGQVRQVLARRLRGLPAGMTMDQALGVLADRLEGEVELGRHHCAVVRRLMAGIYADAKAAPETDTAPVTPPQVQPAPTRHAGGDELALLASNHDSFVAALATKVLAVDGVGSRHRLITQVMTAMAPRCCDQQLVELQGAAMVVRHAIDSDAAVNQELTTW